MMREIESVTVCFPYCHRNIFPHIRSIRLVFPTSRRARAVTVQSNDEKKRATTHHGDDRAAGSS